MDQAAEIARLRRQIERLQADNDALRAQLGQRLLMPVCFGLSPMEERVLARIYASDQVTKDQVYEAIVGGRLDQDAPEPKIVDVLVCKVRRKVKSYGLEIATRWGHGYFLPSESRQRLAAMIAPREAAAA